MISNCRKTISLGEAERAQNSEPLDEPDARLLSTSITVSHEAVGVKGKFDLKNDSDIKNDYFDITNSPIEVPQLNGIAEAKAHGSRLRNDRWLGSSQFLVQSVGNGDRGRSAIRSVGLRLFPFRVIGDLLLLNRTQRRLVFHEKRMTVANAFAMSSPLPNPMTSFYPAAITHGRHEPSPSPA